jgi:hypothetical protein
MASEADDPSAMSSAILRSLRGASRDQVSDVGVSGGESGVERRQTTVLPERLRSQICLSDLAMADYAPQQGQVVRQVVGPKSVVGVGGRGLEEFDGIVGPYSVADQQSNERSLRIWRRCEDSIGLAHEPELA